LGLDPGLEDGRTSLPDYRANLRKLALVIQGKRASIITELEKDMKRHAKAADFEAAAKLRNQLFALQNLGKQVIFSDKEFLDISKDHALTELVDVLGLPAYPRRIEGYDISHMQGTDVVASMVVFTNGVSDKGEYRKFKTKKDHNNDFYNMHETIRRRLSDKNLRGWGTPSLFLIDGGKGQLDAAIRARDQMGCSQVPFVGLAKREEQIVIQKPFTAAITMDTGDVVQVDSGSKVTINVVVVQKLGGYVTETEDFILINLPHSTNAVKLLQRIRDESHRFAVSYHTVLKRQRQTASMLDGIPTIGPVTRKTLIKTFGSLRGVMQARDWEVEKVIGTKKAAILQQYIRPLRKELKNASEG
jgi:excinuclease ABC subunit C